MLQAVILLVLLFERLFSNAYPHCSDLMLSRGLDTVDDSANTTSACRTGHPCGSLSGAGDIDRCACRFADGDFGDDRRHVVVGDRLHESAMRRHLSMAPSYLRRLRYASPAKAAGVFCCANCASAARRNVVIAAKRTCVLDARAALAQSILQDTNSVWESSSFPSSTASS